MKVLITRPETSSKRLAEKLKHFHFETVTNSMLDIVPVAHTIDLGEYAGLLFTSKSAVQEVKPCELKGYTGEVYAVGESTGNVMTELLGRPVKVAGGDSAALVALVARDFDPKSGTLLHVSGQEVRMDLVAALSARGYDIEREVVYDARPASSLSTEVVQNIQAGLIDFALFYSPRSATTFIELARADGLVSALQGVTAIAISPAVAEALEPGGWKAVVAAPKAQESEMIAVLRREAAAESLN